MAHKQAAFRTIRRFFTVLLCCGVIQPAYASYIDALEQEAARGVNEHPATDITPSAVTIASMGGEEQLPPGLGRAEFEATLQREFYGSYVFYSTLSESHKSQVYQEYINNNDIEHLRRVIRIKMR